MNPLQPVQHNSRLGLFTFAACLVCASTQYASAATLVPTFDTRGDNSVVSVSSPLDRGDTADLGVGPIDGSNRFFRTYMTFDLTSESAATSVTLDLITRGAENNTSSLPQTFTLFSMASDWDGATSLPSGTDLATFSITPTSNPHNSLDVSFSNTAALTSAFNNAVGGNLYLGIYSPEGEAASTGTRSFAWFGSREDISTQQPSLTYVPVPEPSAAMLGGLGLLALLRRRR